MVESPRPAPHSRQRVLRNTVALAVGRNLVAVSRLVVIALIVRQLGTEVFGQYALLIALLTVAEGLVDFGTTEVFVRDISNRPGDRQRLLRVLTAARLVQVPLAFALVIGLVLAMGYPVAVQEAALVGGLSLAFLGGAMVYRVAFRVDLTMEREMAAELASVLVLAAGVVWVARSGGGIVGVMAAYTLSRACFFAVSAALGWRGFRLGVAGVGWADLRASAVACGAVGAAGFLVMVYDPLDVLMLSKLGTVEQVALYSAAQRLAWPLLMVLSAVGGTLYSVVAAAWPHDAPRVQAACQQGLDAVVLMGGLALSAGVAAAEFLLQVIGPQVAAGAPILRVLLLLCVVKAVSMTIGPLLLVLRRQREALLFIGLALVAKALAFWWVVPRHGGLGVAWSALAVETVFVVVPSLVLATRGARLNLRYGQALRVLAITALASGITHAVLGGSSLWGVLMGPVLYLLLLLATGTLPLSQWRRWLRRRSTEAPA